MDRSIMAVALWRKLSGLLLALIASKGLCTCNVDEESSPMRADAMVMLQTFRIQEAVSHAHTDGGVILQPAGRDKAQATLQDALSNASEMALCIWPLLIIALGLQLFTSSRVVKEEQKANQVDALAGVRAPLILLICFYHAGIVQVNVVGSFFMLSGMVISMSRIAAHGEVKAPFHSASDVGMFILTRWLRVLPLTICCFCMPHQCNGGLKEFWFEWAVNMVPHPSLFLKDTTNLFSAVNLGQFWFVQSILVLYAFYPLFEGLLVYLRSNVARWWLWILSCCFLLKFCTVVCAYSALQRGALVEGDWYVVPQYNLCLYTFPLLWIPDFLAGMVLPYLEQTRTQIAQSQVLVTCADIIAIGCVLWMFAMPSNIVLLVLSDFHAFAPCTALILWSLLPGDGASLCRRLLSIDLIVQLGNFAFAFYLCHLQVIACVGYSGRARADGLVSYPAAYGLRFNLLPSSFTVSSFFAALLFASLTSWALHSIVERPISQGVRRCLEHKS